MGRDMYAYRGKFIHANCVPAWQSVIPSICAFAKRGVRHYSRLWLAPLTAATSHQHQQQRRRDKRGRYGRRNHRRACTGATDGAG